ncbi:tRNA (adenosine(37)-N6)-threonylcarbamoyltransferase complex ATPase subunit type 1 TsaE, partial [Streptomyces sp. NPDC127077]|uniref:tRNA (adenosine(37)-N6)-threonylcarbamoyltransferase complex ATPase subunit type 1 TsaE n=1 Tax=Streptomyces sp. NPDC127077 TaxID=3347131 RepID=UPI003667051B
MEAPAAAHNPAEPAQDGVGVQITVNSPEQMKELGRRLAKLLRAGDLVMLNGELGAGKTTLTRGLGEGGGSRGGGTGPAPESHAEGPPRARGGGAGGAG